MYAVIDINDVHTPVDEQDLDKLDDSYFGINATITDTDEEGESNFTEHDRSDSIVDTKVAMNATQRYVPLRTLFNKITDGYTLDSEVRVDPNTNTEFTVYYQMNTANKSYIDMYYYLKASGRRNCKFHLLLLDPDLAYIDPHDPNLSTQMKRKVFIECQRNFFYFQREVVRVPSSGGPYIRYILNRGNLASSYLFLLNLNTYQEQARQTGKTVGAEVEYCWVYNFGSRNASIVVLNKKHDDAKRNLGDIKNLIKALPSYLRFDQVFGVDGSKLKGRDSMTYLQHKINYNKIEAIPMARDRGSAVSLLRGRTITNAWIDEAAFFKFLEESLQNGTPALLKAFMNCRLNGAPHGLKLTSTPGFLSDETGQYMYGLIQEMTVFTEDWYDYSLADITELLRKNKKSMYVYVKTTYQQLGLGQEWLDEVIRSQNNKWTDIRREFLLEWATTSETCPFNEQELKNIERFIRKPLKQVYINKFYLFNIYKDYQASASTFRPLIGVDVAAGYGRDSSSIVISDSKTTELLAEFTCNWIDPLDLGVLVHDLVTNFMPKALVTIERNGVGTGTIARLVKSKIKRNLYFEMKEKVLEENLGKKSTRKAWVKSYGLHSSKDIRENLMEILSTRVKHHYDKIYSENIFSQIKTLETKRNGRIEHSSNAHDDTIFAWVLSLYPLYYGVGVKENWNISIPTLNTADDEAEELYGDHKFEEGVDIVQDLNKITNPELTVRPMFPKDDTISPSKFSQLMREQEDRLLRESLATPIARKKYAECNRLSLEEVNEEYGNSDMSHFINRVTYNVNDDNPLLPANGLFNNLTKAPKSNDNEDIFSIKSDSNDSAATYNDYLNTMNKINSDFGGGFYD